MNGVMVTVFLVLAVAFSILVSSPISHWAVAQIENTTLPENTNNTRQIINLKDNTITLINTTTNETIKTIPYTGNTGNTLANETLSGTAANMTANETLSGTAANMTANETLSGTAANMTANETLSGTAANMTANDNLTEKFRELGK
jgi:hypothetical protein